MTEPATSPLTQIATDLKKAAADLQEQGQLAGAEAREAWTKLQPKVAAFEKQASAAAGQAVTDLQDAGKDLLRQVRGLLRRKP